MLMINLGLHIIKYSFGASKFNPLIINNNWFGLSEAFVVMTVVD